ncbi:L-aspartate oxidase [Desulfosediminicola flagellatus]|uniref:L-aspartate oxidase n=1 Tax=Desulfosediminicola flagellatus TaxID=2569541 RepID=UPI0010ABA64F|nr:L-aspartate oxidase [Desulfosediminicola flagellatus]
MKCDFLVVGSGIAGLSFAIRAASLGTVIIITKKQEIDCATNLAQGGIAAVLSEDDDFKLHIEDTLKSGDGLCDKEVVKMVVEEGPSRVKDLVDIGVGFIRSSDNKDNLSLGKEGGHSRRRVAHAYDLTGKEIERALLEKAKSIDNIQIIENRKCIDLLMDKSDNKNTASKCVGAYVLDEYGIETYLAKYTILCTGGVGKVYLYTSNPDIASGDGVAMAFRAGAKIANMEFIQFHPTCLYHHDAKNFLISEAVRGEGAYLINSKGERFMAKYEPEMMELATRDKVARAIDQEMKETGADCVFLDISHKDKAFLSKRFPNIYGKCQELGIDISEKPIPVVPAAHYLCGGVLTDLHGKSSIDRLFALGETACTGLHGGNRLASNSLLEAVVYAERAFAYIEKQWPAVSNQPFIPADDWKTDKAIDLDEEILINHNWDQLRRIMWNYVGIVRSSRRLGLAAQRVSDMVKEIEQHYNDFHVTANLIELRNIAIVAQLIIQAAQLRKSSRGLHYVKDSVSEESNGLYWNIVTRVKDESEYPWQSELCEQKIID